jgi:hypothetical protein
MEEETSGVLLVEAGVLLVEAGALLVEAGVRPGVRPGLVIAGKEKLANPKLRNLFYHQRNGFLRPVAIGCRTVDGTLEVGEVNQMMTSAAGMETTVLLGVI